ncbi:MAG: lysophospholipid acyltransferase family protein [Chlamydiota bacterium]|nr:lysophospholipid acyltransferase family protein [Chlamydiota bacterium]
MSSIPFFFRCMTWSLNLLSWNSLHRLGHFLGGLIYHAYPPFRRRILNNLQKAQGLISPPHSLHMIAKASLQHIAITCLEYAKLAKWKPRGERAKCRNPEVAEALLNKGQGVIFFCGHQSNWEWLFLEGTLRMQGITSGKPSHIPFLDQWIVNIRERFGGQVISQHRLIKEGIRALKSGKFVGIVGDQHTPNSRFSAPFLGQRMPLSRTPAYLAYVTGAPIIVATIKREQHRRQIGYAIEYSPPIWPQASEPQDQEIERMMLAALRPLETSILNNPSQWLWLQNRSW